MIQVMEYQFRDLTGSHNAIITSVNVAENAYYDPTKTNSTSHVLEIEFNFNVDNEPARVLQRLIAPLVKGTGLFSQILDTLGIEVKPGEDFDEQSIVGRNILIQVKKNAKGYNSVLFVMAPADEPKKESVPAPAEPTPKEPTAQKKSDW